MGGQAQPGRGHGRIDHRQEPPRRHRQGAAAVRGPLYQVQRSSRRRALAGDAHLALMILGRGMRAPAWFGALSRSRPDIVVAFGLIDFVRLTRCEVESLGDIFVPAVDIWAELDARAIPEGGLIEQANRDRAWQLNESLVVLLHRLGELLDQPLLPG